LLNKYKKADRYLRNNAVEYLRPLSDLDKLSNELSSGKFEKYAKLIGTALLGGMWGRTLSSFSSIMGGGKAEKQEEKKIKDRIENISNSFKMMRTRSQQVADYLHAKYGVDLQVQNWDYTK
jgi:hypothetical protein